MQYCPFCSATLGKSTQVCPECNNSLDIPLLSNFYQSGESTGTNRSIARKIWIREHAFSVLPLIGIFIGLILGFILSYGYFTMKVATERNQFEERIIALQDSVKQQISAAGNVAADLDKDIKSKEEIIKLLTEQNDFIIQIISFTRRLATNSELTTMDETEIDLFRRNVYYLINQFKERQTKLIATGQFEDKQVNLIPIPQIFE
jgi:hypothetical protein